MAILNKAKLKTEAPVTPTLGGTVDPALAQPVADAMAVNAALLAATAMKTGLTPTAIALAETPVVASPKVKLDENFKSVVPDLTGLSASEKLLTAVAAFEKNKPDVLRRSSVRFSRIAIAIGAKLSTAYEASA